MLTDFQNFCTAEKRMKFATKPMRHCTSHLSHVSTLPGKLKIQVFCRHSADMEEHSNGEVSIFLVTV